MRTIVGVDCATQPEKVGLALAHDEGGVLVIDDVTIGAKRREPVSILSTWLRGREPVLLALDAPLGWPAALGRSLRDHEAGRRLEASADEMFHRGTDSEIRRRLRLRPLEVGANLIARTAHAALTLLADVRRRTGMEIPLAWDPSDSTNDTVAIEVYPAATLAARGAANGPTCLEPLEAEIRLPDSPLLATSPHARDAVLCALAGCDFFRGECDGPADPGLARKEGWIWARRAGL